MPIMRPRPHGRSKIWKDSRGGGLDCLKLSHPAQHRQRNGFNDHFGDAEFLNCRCLDAQPATRDAEGRSTEADAVLPLVQYRLEITMPDFHIVRPRTPQIDSTS